MLLLKKLDGQCHPHMASLVFNLGCRKGINMVTMDQAKKLVYKKFPGFNITASFDYKDIYVFTLMPVGYNAEKDLGFVDNFHSVNKKTGEISGFAPWADLDFFETFANKSD